MSHQARPCGPGRTLHPDLRQRGQVPDGAVSERQAAAPVQVICHELRGGAEEDQTAQGHRHRGERVSSSGVEGETGRRRLRLARERLPQCPVNTKAEPRFQIRIHSITDQTLCVMCLGHYNVQNTEQGRRPLRVGAICSSGARSGAQVRRPLCVRVGTWWPLHVRAGGHPIPFLGRLQRGSGPAASPH